MSLSQAFLDEVRARTTLSTLIGRTVKLQRAGGEFKACCPFHQEKTASFYVNDDKGFFHCFSCAKHGDAIRWLTDHRGLPFIDAVKELAEAAGLAMPAPDPRTARRAERTRGLVDVVADAAQIFAEQLAGPIGGEARAVLDRRGIRPETARAFGLGFAPASRTHLRDTMRRPGRGWGDAILVDAGLLVSPSDRRPQATPYDRFRSRLMIPIRDARGRPIAFGGRIVGDGEPKYLNSPETPLFDKGRTLYNLDRAAPAARRAGRVLAVEGYLDVIQLAQAGIEEVVAPLGTALTEHQLERLWQLSDVPILCFDGDAAGRKAAIRAAVKALPMLGAGRSLRIASLVDGDPDDVVRKGGAAAIEAAIAAAEPLHLALFRHEQAAAPLDTPEARAGLAARLAVHVATIADRETRWQYQRAFRELLRNPPRPTPSPRRPADALHREIVIAALRGLARYPEVLRTSIEDITDLVRGDAETQALTLLIDAVGQGEAVDHAAIDALFPRSRGMMGLHFSFVHPNASADDARADLREVLERLAQDSRRALGEALR